MLAVWFRSPFQLNTLEIRRFNLLIGILETEILKKSIRHLFLILTQLQVHLKLKLQFILVIAVRLTNPEV